MLQQPVATGVYWAAYLRWSSTGENLYYAAPGASGYTAYRQPVTGGPAVAMFEKPNIERWDILRDGRDGLILNYSAPDTGQTIPFATWDGTNLTQVYSQLIGVDPHYTCDNTKLIYRSYSSAGSRGPLKVFTPATGADVTYTRDQNVSSADWIPCD